MSHCCSICYPSCFSLVPLAILLIDEMRGAAASPALLVSVAKTISQGFVVDELLGRLESYRNKLCMRLLGRILFINGGSSRARSLYFCHRQRSNRPNGNANIAVIQHVPP